MTWYQVGFRISSAEITPISKEIDKMKVSENKPHSVHLRLNDEQWQFLSADAEMLGVGVTEYVRMIINTTMYASKKVAESIKAKSLGDLGNEDKTNNKQHFV